MSSGSTQSRTGSLNILFIIDTNAYNIVPVPLNELTVSNAISVDKMPAYQESLANVCQQMKKGSINDRVSCTSAIFKIYIVRYTYHNTLCICRWNGIYALENANGAGIVNNIAFHKRAQ